MPKVANIRDYYRKNFLYENHRLMLPELRDKVTRTCSECKFFVTVVGKTEARPGCAVLIPAYANMTKRVPGKLDVVEVLKAVGKEGLERMLAEVDPYHQACGLFHQRT